MPDVDTQVVNNNESLDGKNEETNLWSSLLRNSLANSSKVKAPKTILFLGPKRSGKDSIATRMKKKELDKMNKGIGLAYSSIDLPAEDEDYGRLNLWTLDSNDSYKKLMKFAINETTIQDSLVLLTLDLSTPWEALIQLDSQITSIENHLSSLQLSIGVVDEMKANLRSHFQYPDRLFQEAEKAKGEAVALPIENGVLEKNLGIPIIVVCTKCDKLMTLDKLTDEHFDFIQAKLRAFCLKYGASLIYTAAATNGNCQLLLNYINHLLYGTSTDLKPNVLDRESIFVPTGWDSLKKIQLMYENLTTINSESQYEDVITAPIGIKNAGDQFIQCEEEQRFLERQHHSLDNKRDKLQSSNISNAHSHNNNNDNNKSNSSSNNNNTSSSSDGRSSNPSSPSSTHAVKQAMGEKLKGAGSRNETPPANPLDGELANFFQDLLKKGATKKSPRSDTRTEKRTPK